MKFDTLALEMNFFFRVEQFESQSGVKMTVTTIVSFKVNQNESVSGMLSFHTFLLHLTK